MNIFKAKVISNIPRMTFVHRKGFIRVSSYSLLFSLFIVFALPEKVFSQTNNVKEIKGYTYGFLIKNENGDTVYSHIKNSFDNSDHYFVNCIMEDGTVKKCTAFEYSYFKRGNDEFKAINLKSKDNEANNKFLVPVINNYLSLYKDIKEYRNNNKALQKVEYFLILENDDVIKFESHNLSRKLTLYLNDYPELAQKVLNNDYSISTLDEVVREYNGWIDDGKPFSPESKKLQKENEDTYYEKYDKSFGLEISAMANLTMMHAPKDMDKIISFKANGYAGYDLKGGVKLRVYNNYFIRMGVQNWTKNATYQYELMLLSENNDTLDFFNVEEKGSIKYTGIYLLNDFEFENGFISFGLNISLAYKYYNEFTQFDSKYNGLIPFLKNKPLFTDEFENQADLEISAGYKYKFNPRWAIKPVLTFIVPMAPLYYSGIVGIYENEYGDRSERDLNIYAYQIKAGLIIDFGISK